MSWLTPIGFLGLLGLAVLILIYVIKPNYQNKRISTTFVWRKSLKYTKKRIPISRLHNLLTLLCQILILTVLGVSLAGPVIKSFAQGNKEESVIIIDASASMRMKDAKETRFERAVKQARERAKAAFDGGSYVTLILADDSADYLFTRVGGDGKDDALDIMDGLALSLEEYCGFSSSDITGAMTLAEAVASVNPAAEVYLYTATEYAYDSGVNVINVASEDEWNAAILGCSAELDNDNHYKITVNAACYGKTSFLTVYCEIHGANGDESKTVKLEKGEFFDPSSEEKEIVFTSDDMSEAAVYSYDYIEAYVGVRDSFPDDNSYLLYGGKRSVVKIQYASSSPNNFFESAIRTIRERYKEIWDVQFAMLRADEAAATEGYDIYIFEHSMPDVLPTDGVVLLVDPRTAPLGSDLQIGSSYSVDSSSTLSAGVQSRLTEYTTAQRITISKYNDILTSEGYEELMFYNNRPVMLLRDTPESRVFVWAFDLNYSNLIALPDFSILIYNMFNSFIYKAFDGYTFEVGESIKLHGMTESLKITFGDEEYAFSGAEGEFTPSRPGTHTVTEASANGSERPEESFFVKIPSEESDASKTADVLPFTRAESVKSLEYEDIILYFAVALFTLMLAEWLLEIKRNY
ncbi:MAG: BatA and WFA domain-containing protein [Clostridia bacterium]|nr:BatA and WFA domain-containing protein [Clostridia bacterium]